ncbi:MAG: hypothetical protein WA996_22930 [Candidatus Promineifilaceae bacterium]
MSDTTLRFIIAAVFFVHGLGNVLGIMAALQLSTLDSWSSRSWLLTGLIGDTASRVISFVLFLAALIGFVRAALALMGWLLPHEWWRSMSVVSALISIAVLMTMRINLGRTSSPWLAICSNNSSGKVQSVW